MATNQYEVNGFTEIYNPETGEVEQVESVATVRVYTEDEPTEAEDTAAMLVDHEYRLTLLELGITESEV